MTISDTHATVARALIEEPKRKRRSIGRSMRCEICKGEIMPLHRYYDGGPRHKAHDVCVEAVLRRKGKP